VPELLSVVDLGVVVYNSQYDNSVEDTSVYITLGPVFVKLYICYDIVLKSSYYAELQIIPNRYKHFSNFEF